MVDLSLAEAGQAARIRIRSGGSIDVLSLGDRVQLPWLDRILVTPHCIVFTIRSVRNITTSTFAEALPIFDMSFRYLSRPEKRRIPATGVGPKFQPLCSFWSAQFGPLWTVAKVLIPNPLIRRSEADSA